MPRYIIPYEVAIDFLEGDVLLTWQPTWSLSRSSNFGIRGSIGIADGLVRSSSEEDGKLFHNWNRLYIFNTIGVYQQLGNHTSLF